MSLGQWFECPLDGIVMHFEISSHETMKIEWRVNNGGNAYEINAGVQQDNASIKHG